MTNKSVEQFEQVSCLMDDAQMAMEMVKAMVGARGPLDASRVYFEAQGELLQLTFEYVEQIARVVDAAMQRLGAKHMQ